MTTSELAYQQALDAIKTLRARAPTPDVADEVEQVATKLRVVWQIISSYEK
jgi:hypothetical protein